MEKTLITWSVPNMVTIWLMLAIGFLVLALISQAAMKWGGNLPWIKQPQVANNAPGY